jgi:UDP-2,3-diacylglucosamine pyrophosphatase LpxH
LRSSRQAIHQTADGRRLLVLHGDEFDAITLSASLARACRRCCLRTAVMALNYAGATKYRSCAWAALLVTRASMAKQKVKNAVEFICGVRGNRRERGGRSAASMASICRAYPHRRDARRSTGVEYYNDGDWVEGCTALVEALRWPDGNSPLGR